MRPATGRGVRVAIVDSGVAHGHPHVGDVTEGFGIERAPAGTLTVGHTFADVNGHGTACAAVVRWGAPDATLIATRVLDRHLRAPADALALAFDRLALMGVDVVNISLGVPDETAWSTVDASFRALLATGAVLVAAVRSDGCPTLPASHAGVIAVDADPALSGWTLRAGGRAGAAFTACPYPRPIPGRDPRDNFVGPSFAAPRVAALAARIREKEPGVPAATVAVRLLAWTTEDGGAE